ncbi:MAG: histidine kinase dimerization/phospho-acceptor domain-containing protein [Gemmatimonadales bacterium]
MKRVRVHFPVIAPVSHRPPLPRRWGLYCVIAFLAPSLVFWLVPPELIRYRDLVWLITLIPAFLLSLHYGMKGAVAGLLMGTALFLAVQYLVALQEETADWRITVPIYVAYGTVAIAVGWLSEQLHVFYARALEGERVAAVAQVAVTIRHEVNNALTAILAEAEHLRESGRFVNPVDKTALEGIIEMAKRIRTSVDRLSALTTAPVTEYLPGVPMIDLSGLPAREPGAAG